MTDFFSLLKLLGVCTTVFAIAVAVLLSLPQSRLRSVGMEIAKYLVAIVCAVLLVSPIDLLPLLPFDDIGYIAGGIAAIASARGDRRRRAASGAVEVRP